MTATVIRLACFEGAAIFGLVLCLVGIQSGELARMPVYWVNLFSPVVFVLLVLATFPTRWRVETLFVRRFEDQIWM
ncbi:MAG: hypothetical protein GXY41_05615 [Phycisphaerae bacterium]|nr:hypothetical protein [Phycisphaerae bacterium]